jgi:hypothetical protein
MNDLSDEEKLREKKILKAKYVLNQGTFMGLALAVAYYFAHLAGIMDSFFHNVLVWGIYIGFIHISILRYRDRIQEGFLSYGQGVWIGTRMGILAGINMGAYMYLYIKVINPAYLEDMIVQMQEASLQMGMTEEEVARMDDFYALTTNPFTMIASGIFSTGFGSFILSLIISIFLRKKGDPFSDAMQNIK